MKDEIKEINIPENVLVALGDLANGALNYYKATEAVKVRHNTIFDYITNLQQIEQEHQRINGELREENEKLKKARDSYRQEFRISHNDLEMYIRKYECLKEENGRLKRLANKDYTELNIVELKAFDYKSRNEKAIEYCELNKEFTPRLEDVKNILNSGDKDE